MSSLSRIVRFGTIYTRIRDLMRAGVLKEKDRPLWYDTMKHFPPLEPPSLEREIPDGAVIEILYPEDVVRAKFYKTYGTVHPMNLSNHSSVQNSPCYRFISKYQELEKTWTESEDELFEATASALSEEGLRLRKKGQGKRPVRVDPTHKSQEEDSIISKEGIADLLKSTLADTQPQGR